MREYLNAHGFSVQEALLFDVFFFTHVVGTNLGKMRAIPFGAVFEEFGAILFVIRAFPCRVFGFLILSCHTRIL